MANGGNVNIGGSLIFDHRVQEWNIFKSRFQQYCTANNITEESDKSGVKRRALLLTALVEDTYRVARDLAFPTELENIEYKVLLEKLSVHFVTKKCSFAERYKFYRAEQRPGEDLAEWAARVRSLSQYCGFTFELETAMRDRFVLGLENVKEREKLFAESIMDLTFSRALELAQSVRCARFAMQSTSVTSQLGVPASPQDVFAMHSRGVNKCSVCGYSNHSKDQCRFSSYSCKKCHKKGHLRRMCKSLIKPNNYIAANDDDIVQGIYDLFTIKCNNGEPMRHMVFIGETGLVCEIDSGSAVSILPFRVYENYFKNIYNLNKSKVILNCYNGSKISPVGFITVPVTYESRIEHIRLFIIQTNNKQPALLGRDFISAFNLQLCTANCNNLTINTNYDSILREKYAKLFSSELGTFNKFKIHLKLKCDAELKFFKPRPVPLALKSGKRVESFTRLGYLRKSESLKGGHAHCPSFKIRRGY
ncbi:unnamed protein product [Parnassius mnemosyne]|uniref:CCHC-type domain-containing protein n=1 Tax=Parnassius mnemosyne TaxID=213953 RepID=A0AAV1LRE7_9NEOP